MKIEDLLSGKSDDQKVTVDGISIPTRSLKKLMAEGYENLKIYEENHTLSLWGKTCTACFTEEQVREMG